ncbi:MAG: MarR family transcriptional regulator [Caldilineaceae bacterium]|nr:MarR family transcriptional regulator [Caldilineaceae bacterium]MCB9156979.1 MarR family transcriptional regulator [Caldilineaceae bacterium]
MALGIYPDKESPTSQILEHLQRKGSATIKDFEQLLGVTTTAVRQHLNTLQAEGYIERRRVSVGVGRPHHAYFVTDKVRELLACHCDDLALTLLEEVFALEGVEKVNFLLERVGKRLADRYQQSVQSVVLQERVNELAGALSRHGVLTDVVAQEDDMIMLKTYNCPYHDLAYEHQEICNMDQNMIRQVLGSDVSLSSRIMDGDGCCAFVVRQASRASQEKS